LGLKSWGKSAAARSPAQGRWLLVTVSRPKGEGQRGASSQPLLISPHQHLTPAASQSAFPSAHEPQPAA